MDKNKFIDDLTSQLKELGERAFMDGDGCIRITRSTPGTSTTEYCPITFLATVKTGHFYATHEWYHASKAIGLSYEDTLDIMYAEDVNEPTTTRTELVNALMSLGH